MKTVIVQKNIFMKTVILQNLFDRLLLMAVLTLFICWMLFSSNTHRGYTEGVQIPSVFRSAVDTGFIITYPPRQ